MLTLDPHTRTYRITRRREARGWLADVPLIILNATADASVLLDLLGRDRATAEVYNPRLALPPDVEIVQLTDASYGKTTLCIAATARETRARALERVRAVVDPALTTGLITFKDIESEVGDALGIDPARTAHFGAIAGSNAFAALEQLVVLGTFSPPPAATVELASAIYAGHAPLVEGQELRRVPYPGWRDTDGHGLAINVVAFTDGRIDRLYRELRDGALLQAAHRLRLHRPNGRSRVRLILATALPLADLPPTAIERRTGPTTQAASEAIIVALATALADLVNGGGVATRSALATATGYAKSTVGKYWSAAVERAGLVVERRIEEMGMTARPVEVAVLPALHPGRSVTGGGLEHDERTPTIPTGVVTPTVEAGVVAYQGRPMPEVAPQTRLPLHDPWPDFTADTAQWEYLLCEAYRYNGGESGIYAALREARCAGAVLYWRGEQLRLRPANASAKERFATIAATHLQPHQRTIAALLQTVATRFPRPQQEDDADRRPPPLLCCPWLLTDRGACWERRTKPSLPGVACGGPRVSSALSGSASHGGSAFCPHDPTAKSPQRRP